MKIGKAIKKARCNNIVARKCWKKGTGVGVVTDGNGVTHLHEVISVNGVGLGRPWHPSGADILADDWIVIGAIEQAVEIKDSLADAVNAVLGALDPAAAELLASLAGDEAVAKP